MLTFLILQLTAHLLADFTFQPERWCVEKEKHIFSKYHVYHVLVVFALAWLFSFSVGFWWIALLIGILHLAVDVLKSLFYSKNIGRKYLFFIDQTLHIIIIVCGLWLYSKTTNVFIPFFISEKLVFILFALLACTKPSNFFIKNFMQVYGIMPSEADENNALLKAGRIIGSLERLISLVLIMYNQFAAVGFIIAAKSILRFRDSQTAKTEYLLIGTLLSFGIAFLFGIACKFI